MGTPNLTSGLLVIFWMIFQATCTCVPKSIKDTLPLTFTYTRQETLNLHENFSSGKLSCFWVPTTLFLRVQRCFVSFNVEFINPLSPKSDQHQISPRNINALLNRVTWELRTWSHKMNLRDILSASPRYFCRKWIGA